MSTKYYNSFVQTGHDIPKPLRFHRTTQTIKTHNSTTQSSKNNTCQTIRIGQDTRFDKILVPGDYIHSTIWYETRTSAATTIQRYYKGYKSRQLVSKLRNDRTKTLFALQTEIDKRDLILYNRLVKETSARVYPKTSGDFEKLRKDTSNYKDIANLDKLQQKQAQALHVQHVKQVLRESGKDKLWIGGKDRGIVYVETCSTRRAKIVLDLYNLLQSDINRLQTFIKVKEFVRNEELEMLMDREIKGFSSDGLKRRLSNLFLRVCQVDSVRN
jgi:IQ calmodulin-binding motif